jgi:hypothetical protein
VSWNGQTYAFLSYLIAWSTLPFGGFLAFAPLVSAIVVVLIAEGCRGWLGWVGASSNGG